MLALEDPAAADDAQAAQACITRGKDLKLVTQHGVQDFCWHELTVKWMTGPDGHERVVTALARAFGRGTRPARPGGDWADHRYQLTPSAPRLPWRRCAPATGPRTAL